MKHELTFIATRSDGLGERLRAVLSAWALSKVFNCDFKFAWRNNLRDHEFLAMQSPQHIFSQDFLNMHLLDHTKKLRNHNLSNFDGESKTGVYQCEQSLPKEFEKFLQTEGLLQRYRDSLRKAFWEINYNPQVCAVIAAAQSVLMTKPTVAMHLRSGDLMYGDFRYAIGYLGKALPHPLVQNIIDQMASRGKEVLLFGEDQSQLEYLASNNRNVSLASAHRFPTDDKLLAAFFDVILMSRCDEIHAGNSGFAVLSSMIGSAQYFHFGDTFSKELRVNLTLDYLRKCMDVGAISGLSISKEQISYACKAALVDGFDFLPSTDFSFLASTGRAVAPDSPVFDILYLIKICCTPEPSMVQMMELADQLVLKNRAGLDLFVKTNLKSEYQKRKFKNLFGVNYLNVLRGQPSLDTLRCILSDSLSCD